MAKKTVINYGALVNRALRSVVRDALSYIENDCMPGKHSFFISFLTKHNGVKLSSALQKKYPHELSIILENEFDDLEVEEDRFTVTLGFGSFRERICVPFKAVIFFKDESVDFEMAFNPMEDEEGLPSMWSSTRAKIGDEVKVTAPGDNLVFLDDFRKKR